MKAIIGSTEYKMTPFKSLPKKGNGQIQVRFGDNPTLVDVKVTTNAAWCKDTASVLCYVWFEHEGKAYYITGTPGVSLGDEFHEATIAVHAGNAARKDPIRAIPPVDAAFTEGHRIEKFKATWAKRHG